MSKENKFLPKCSADEGLEEKIKAEIAELRAECQALYETYGSGNEQVRKNYERICALEAANREYTPITATDRELLEKANLWLTRATYSTKEAARQATRLIDEINEHLARQRPCYDCEQVEPNCLCDLDPQEALIKEKK